MELSAHFSGPAVQKPPVELADLGYIKTERDAIHETAVLLDFVTSWMTERGYAAGLACLDLLLEKKCNIKDRKKPLTRQDGETPSIIHELSQALYTIALVESGFPLPDPEIIMCLNFTHDLGEEFGVTKLDLMQHLDRHKVPYNSRIRILGDMFEDMTKSRNDVYKYDDNHAYFLNMLNRPEKVMAKFLDRIHNMATLIGVKSLEKHKEYIVETMELRDSLEQGADLYPDFAKTFSVLDQIVKAQIYFNSVFLNKMDPQNPVNLRFDNLPRLHRMDPLPAGLDPLQITQARGTWKIMREMHMRAPAPDGVA